MLFIRVLITTFYVIDAINKVINYAFISDLCVNVGVITVENQVPLSW